MSNDQRFARIERAVGFLEDVNVPAEQMAAFAAAVVVLQDAVDWLEALRATAAERDRLRVTAIAYRDALSRGNDRVAAYHGAALDRVCDGEE